MGHFLKRFEAAPESSPPFYNCGWYFYNLWLWKDLESLLLGEVSHQLACLAEARQWTWWLWVLSMLKKAGEATSAPLAGCTYLCLQSYISIRVLVLLHDWESYYYSNSSNNNNNNPIGNSETYIWKVKTWRLFCFPCIFGCLFLWQICISTNVISLPVITYPKRVNKAINHHLPYSAFWACQIILEGRWVEK